MHIIIVGKKFFQPYTKLGLSSNDCFLASITESPAIRQHQVQGL